MARRVPPPILAAALVALLLACGKGEPARGPAADGSEPARDQPPIPLDANPPVEYPADLFSQGVSGTVVLLLFVDEAGVIVSDSTRIEESSGYPAMDSAAVAAVGRLRYAPALRGGTAVAAPFRQPIHFRHPTGEAQIP